MIRTIDLFAGAGLMTEGFRRAGFTCVFAAEADARAVTTFNQNLEPAAEVWDVKNVKDGLTAEVLVAGPPCQGFSSLGKRDTNDQRNKLSLEILRWMAASQPEVVVIENVPQFLKSRYWARIRNESRRRGYESTTWVLNSVDFGAPQNRERAFAIISRIGLPSQPAPTHKIHKTVGDAFKGLPKRLGEEMQHIGPIPQGIAEERIKIIPKNGDKRDLMRDAPHLCPQSWFKMGAQATDVWGRMDVTKPANTIRCSFQNASKGRYIHPTENRVISLREGARLQGVPDHWIFHGDRSSMARQIGNGVPIPLAEAVARAIATLFYFDESTSTLAAASAVASTTGLTASMEF